VLCCGPLQRAAAARWGRVQREAQAVVTGEHEGRATGGRRENAVYSTYPPILLWGLNPHHWLSAFLEACAENGGQSPTELGAFLP